MIVSLILWGTAIFIIACEVLAIMHLLEKIKDSH